MSYLIEGEMILNDYKCAMHGFFESDKPICPHGCDTVQKVFLQPVGTIGDKTKEAQPPRIAPPQGNPFAVQWGNPSQISNYNTQSIAGENPNGLASAGGRFNQPKTASYIGDHEKLKLDG
ncbi:MAG: hypothetical protein EBR82_83795 [Caulobacteraceae bacterium]|nr:hypothetical protein [Caulobacteraceae bacterium]